MYPFKCQSRFTTESSHLSFLPGGKQIEIIRLLKTNLLTIQKNRDASNNRDSIIRSETLEESFSKKVFYRELEFILVFRKKDRDVYLRLI